MACCVLLHKTNLEKNGSIFSNKYLRTRSDDWKKRAKNRELFRNKFPIPIIFRKTDKFKKGKPMGTTT